MTIFLENGDFFFFKSFCSLRYYYLYYLYILRVRIITNYIPGKWYKEQKITLGRGNFTHAHGSVKKPNGKNTIWKTMYEMEKCNTKKIRKFQEEGPTGEDKNRIGDNWLTRLCDRMVLVADYLKRIIMTRRR